MHDAIALGCFFLSGVAGLVYEVCWIRQAGLIFGSTIYAVSTVLAVFFLGLAALAALSAPAFRAATAAYGTLLGILPDADLPFFERRLT